MALCAMRPIPGGTLRRNPARKMKMTMAMRSGTRTSLDSTSWGTISLAEVLRNVAGAKRSEQHLEAELPGCTVLGTICQHARVYKQPALGLLTALQDDQDSSLNIKLLVNNFTVASTTDAEAQLWFPRGAKVRILEPRVLVAGPVGFAMFVDNPASLEIIGMELLTSTEKSSNKESAKVYWSAGNAALARGEYVKAAHFYRECVERGFPGVLQAFSRSCEAWLKLSVYEKAYADASQALTLSPSHFQSLFVKGQALLGMQEYERAVKCFGEAEAVAAESDKAKVVAARERSSILHEQSVTGIYDLSKYLLSGRSPDSAPECSDFIKDIKLGVVEGKGRGLFATRDLKAGELILVSNSIARSRKRGEEFHALIGRACMTDRRTIARLTAFFDQQEMFNMDLFLPNSDWYRNHTDHAVPTSSYRYVFKELGKRNGLCPLATMINHSCLPNVSRQPVGGALFVRASRDILKGEELLTCYFDPFVPLVNRRKQTAERNFEFVCSCERCKLEEQIDLQKPGLASRYFDALQNREDASASLMELVKLSVELDSMTGDEKSKQWIMSSYPYAFWAAAYLSGKTKSEKEARLEKAVAALHATAPGHLSTLRKMVEVCSPGGAALTSGPEYRSDVVMELLRQEAVCCFGEQTSDVFEAVIKTPGGGEASGDLSF